VTAELAKKANAADVTAELAKKANAADASAAVSGSGDIELNGYRVPKEVLNFLMDTPLDLILQRLSNFEG